jgi:FtsZ-interacting cell division protein ZipA
MKILIVVLKVVIVLGGLSGLWSTYTTHDALKFKQPFEEHDQLAKSYVAQITSAEKRNDIKEVTRVRRDYEAFEEKWRAGRQIAKIVAPIESLAEVQLSAEETAALRELMAKGAEGPTAPVISATTLGAAYLALNDFEDSAKQLNIATSKKKDPNALALKAAAYGGLASHATTDLKQKYEAAAVESFNAALKVSPKPTELTDFALAIPSLKAILEKNGVKLTNR